MKHRNRRILQTVVILVLGFFILSTVGLSLISLTYDSSSVHQENTDNAYENVESGVIDDEIFDGVVVTGSFEE